VLENRCAHGLNKFLPAEGLAVFHCDINGSNEWQDGTPSRHYQVALIQADGRLDLEKNVNDGDQFDLFRPGQSVHDQTQQPNTRKWDGQPSGLSVDSIRISDDIITVKIGLTQVSGDSKTEVLESNKIINIPDNYVPGISTNLAVTGFGRIEMVQVSLKITHSYRGDLKVSLRHGSSGFEIAKKNINDSNKDLIVTDLDVTQGFQGGEANGNWTLVVADLMSTDFGKLVFWQIKVRYAPHAT
jgi:subtilisin-like proprotein convertase family protein